MQEITLFNDHIMVKELERENDSSSYAGLIIPKENLEDEQVAQGTVVKSPVDMFDIKIGDVLMFHKVMPIDINLKLEEDEELTPYFFIKSKDIICKIENK